MQQFRYSRPTETNSFEEPDSYALFNLGRMCRALFYDVDSTVGAVLKGIKTPEITEFVEYLGFLSRSLEKNTGIDKEALLVAVAESFKESVIDSIPNSLRETDDFILGFEKV